MLSHHVSLILVGLFCPSLLMIDVGVGSQLLDQANFDEAHLLSVVGRGAGGSEQSVCYSGRLGFWWPTDLDLGIALLVVDLGTLKLPWSEEIDIVKELLETVAKLKDSSGKTKGISRRDETAVTGFASPVCILVWSRQI
ncbi:hypothetical protein ACLOJK_041179 [Asimina triloba]